jgi:hypothetical protein
VVFGVFVDVPHVEATLPGENVPRGEMRDHWLLLAVWSLPVTMMFAGAIWIPLAPVVLIMFVCWLLRRLAQGDRSEAGALPEQSVLASS